MVCALPAGRPPALPLIFLVTHGYKTLRPEIPTSITSVANRTKSHVRIALEDDETSVVGTSSVVMNSVSVLSPKLLGASSVGVVEVSTKLGTVVVGSDIKINTGIHCFVKCTIVIYTIY